MVRAGAVDPRADRARTVGAVSLVEPNRSSLVGRGEELAFVLGHLAGWPGGEEPGRDAERGGGVVLAGAAGVGKSRLAREVVDRLDAEGRVVHRHVATRAGASIPFGCLLTLIPSPAGAFGAGDNRLDALRRVLDRLRAEARRDGPPVLVIDDAHLLDEASAALLVQIDLERCASLLLTIRSGEPAPAEVTSLWRNGGLARLDLQALSLDQTARLVSLVLGGPVDERALDRVWRVTTGNPLFVREVVRNALRDDTLRRHQGLWTWHGDLRPDGRLVDAVRADVDHVEGGVRSLVHLVAVADEVPVALLDHLPDAVHLADAERAGLLRLDPATGRVALAHPLYGEVLRAELPASEQRTKRWQLARALRAAGDQPDSVMWAAWLLDAGDLVDPDLLIRGARQANVLLDYAVARNLATAALETATDPGQRLQAGLALTFALNGEARWAEADAVLNRLVDEPGPDDLRARLALEHTRARVAGLDDVDGGLELLQRWADNTSDHVWHDVIVAERAGVLAAAGRSDEAMAIALALLEPGNDDRVRLKAFGAIGVELAQRGRVAQVQELADELLPASLVLRSEIPGAPFAIIVAQLLCHTIEGNLDALDAIVSMAVAAYAGGDDEARGLLLAAQGGASLLRGRVRTACDQLGQAIGLLEASGRTARIASVAMLLVEASALDGDPVAASAALDRARRAFRANEARQEPILRRAAAWELAVRDGPVAGRLAAMEAADWAHSQGMRWVEVSCLHDAVRLGAGRDAGRRLARVARSVDGRLPACVAALGAAVASGDGNGVLAVTDRLSELGFELIAADSAAVAARLLRRTGDLTGAARAEERAAALVARCEGRGSPIFAAEAERDRPALTRREREIVHLAAAGRSNRAIADELVLSVRTVEGHLARAYAKLGVERRADLAALVDPG